MMKELDDCNCFVALEFRRFCFWNGLCIGHLYPCTTSLLPHLALLSPLHLTTSLAPPPLTLLHPSSALVCCYLSALCLGLAAPLTSASASLPLFTCLYVHRHLPPPPPPCWWLCLLMDCTLVADQSLAEDWWLHSGLGCPSPSIVLGVAAWPPSFPAWFVAGWVHLDGVVSRLRAPLEVLISPLSFFPCSLHILFIFMGALKVVVTSCMCCLDLLDSKVAMSSLY